MALYLLAIILGLSAGITCFILAMREARSLHDLEEQVARELADDPRGALLLKSVPFHSPLHSEEAQRDHV